MFGVPSGFEWDGGVVGVDVFKGSEVLDEGMEESGENVVGETVA